MLWTARTNIGGASVRTNSSTKWLRTHAFFQEEGRELLLRRAIEIAAGRGCSGRLEQTLAGPAFERAAAPSGCEHEPSFGRGGADFCCTKRAIIEIAGFPKRVRFMALGRGKVRARGREAPNTVDVFQASSLVPTLVVKFFYY